MFILNISCLELIRIPSCIFKTILNPYTTNSVCKNRKLETAMHKKNCHNTIAHQILLLALALITVIFTGFACASTEPGDGVGGVSQEGFAWDTVRQPPRWRASSPIEWRKTGNPNEIYDESQESGKPVLCYVSRYDLDVTATIEDVLFSADTWGGKIQENFVPWEIDWWEYPGLAEMIVESNEVPMIAVLLASSDSPGELCLADSWSGSELLSFPLHEGLLPLDNPEAEEAINGFSELTCDDVLIVSNHRITLDPEVSTDRVFNSLAQSLKNGDGITPQYAMAVLFANPLDEEVRDEVSKRVDAWFEYVDEIGNDQVWMPEEAFLPGSGWSIYPQHTLEAVMVSAILNPEDVKGLDNVIPALGDLIFLESGNPGGGFPAYIDIRGTFNANQGYVNDDYDMLGMGGYDFSNQVMGPRDIRWVNARMLATLLKLAGLSTQVMETEITDGVTVQDFIESGCGDLYASLSESNESVDENDYAEHVAMLDLYNTLYQHSADIEKLENAESIVELFVEVRPWDYSVLGYMTFNPDLAIGLYHFGWLAENEEAREEAASIAEHVLGNFGSTGKKTLPAYAYRMVNSPCPHIGIVAPIDDPVARELLNSSLREWDPRKVAQILDPDRDKELIELKWYVIQENPTAYVCIDEMCYPPTGDPDELLELILEVLNDLASESDE